MSEVSRENFLLRCWHFLWRPSLTWPWLVLVILGGVIGVAAAGVTAGALWYTSTDQFCSGCHQIAIVPEWQKSVHYVNAVGFKAGCADCHEPHDPVGMVLRKTAAIDEVWNEFLGTISTPEKFEAQRYALAQKEWARLRADNSAECRDCHQLTQMNDPNKAFLNPMHRTALANGQTCIDCHKGVAHKAPTAPAATAAKIGGGS